MASKHREFAGSLSLCISAVECDSGLHDDGGIMSATVFTDLISGVTPSGKAFKYRLVKKGRTTLGELRLVDDKIIYFAYRKPSHLFKALNAWAIDCETIDQLKTRAVTHVGILVSNGDKYIISLRDFLDKDKGTQVLDFSKKVGENGKLGAKQYYCPIENFMFVSAPAELAMKAAITELCSGIRD